MRFLITAGPTKEAIDPVRYITNRSSGKMGYSLAEAAAHDGHRVLLISGPTSLDVPHGVDFLPVETAQEMYDAVQNQAPYADIAILSAAVADYRPVSVPDRKIKKTGERMILELERTKDILGSMRMEFGFRGILVGFAAETHDVESYARGKLERKQCDMIVANDVSRRDIGFDASETKCCSSTRTGRTCWKKPPKRTSPTRSWNARAALYAGKACHPDRHTFSGLEPGRN